MREKLDRYLYRAKEVDNDEWVYGYYWSNDLGHHFIRTTRKTSDNILKDYEIIPETVGQFTGLLDKNCKKIFEGDIVEFDSDRKRSAVIWGSGEYNQLNGFRLEKYPLFSVSIINCHLFKVIGNIHDNPELLSEVQYETIDD